MNKQAGSWYGSGAHRAPEDWMKTFLYRELYKALGDVIPVAGKHRADS